MKELKRRELSVTKRELPKRGEKRPNFDSLFDPTGAPNPLDRVAYSGNLEDDAQEEISEALKAIIEQKQAMREVYRLTTDPEFWVCVCFQSREQKEQFLELAGWNHLGDKYLDGLRLADLLGLDVPPINLTPTGAKLAPKRLRGETIQNLDGDGGDS